MTKSRNLTNQNVIIALTYKTKLERDCKVKSLAAALLRTETRLTARDLFFGGSFGSRHDSWLSMLLSAPKASDVCRFSFIHKISFSCSSLWLSTMENKQLNGK